MKRFFAFIMMLVFLAGNTTYAQEIEEPNHLYAQAAVLMDADSGRILFEKNGQEVLAMASTTKIMTCILTLEKGNINDAVTVSEYAVSQPKVHLGMRAGEQFVLKDLLYSLMLESHNDSAVAIAEHISGSVEEFAKLMNLKAKEIGCNSTYFITPNGLDEVNETGMHSTTAGDLARIMSYCVTKSPKKDEFLSITSTPNHSFTNVEESRNFSCNNKNLFLTMMDGAISGKTGFTGKAGYCYVGALKRDERTFVVALLACGWPNNKNYKWADTRKLMEYAIDNYTYRDVYEEVEIPEIPVEDGIPQSENLFDESYVELKVEDAEKKAKVLIRSDEHVEVRTEYAERIEAPVDYGTKVGSVSYYLKGEKIAEYPIVVANQVQKKDLNWYLCRIAELYFVG